MVFWIILKGREDEWEVLDDKLREEEGWSSCLLVVVSWRKREANGVGWVVRGLRGGWEGREA